MLRLTLIVTVLVVGLLTGESANSAAPQVCAKVQKEIVDLDMLVDGLKKSDAVGVFDKLLLKSAIDDLIARLRAFHGGSRQYTLEQLQGQYDVLMMRIARALEDKDMPLHGQLCSAWDSLWATLKDRNRFVEKLS